MGLIKRLRTEVKLWLLMMTSFVIVGAGVGFAVQSISLNRYDEKVQGELLNIVNLLVLSVDAEEHEKLVSVQQQDSELYKKQIDRLAQAQASLNGVRYVYTLRKSAHGYHFILDPTPPGDHDKDGIEDKSYLLDPYPEISQYAKKAFETGQPCVEREAVTDRWGTFLSAYAPIIDSKGNVVAVIGVDRDVTQLSSMSSTLWETVGWGIGLALLLGGLFSAVITRQIRQASKAEGWLERLAASAQRARSTYLELILMGLACSMILVSASGYQSMVKAQRELAESETRVARIEALLSHIGTLDPQAPMTERQAKSLADQSRAASANWLPSRIGEYMAAESFSERQQLIGRMKLGLSGDHQELGISLSALNQAIDSKSAGLTIAFCIAALLAFGSVALLRAAKSQQHALDAARQETDRQRHAYTHVAENLPIGFYTYAKGAFTYTNRAWNEQTGLMPDEAPMQGLIRALHPADRESFFTALTEAEEQEEPVVRQFKLVTVQSGTRIVETRAVPVRGPDGRYEHFLGFTIDITERVTAQRRAEAQSNELNIKNQMLSKALSDLEENFSAMVTTLVKAVEAKDPYTAGHSERVMGYSVAIGRAFELDAHRLRVLEMGTLIHDIGKIGIPDEILLKPDRLTHEEFEIIRTHPDVGTRMIEGIPLFQECIPIVRGHHERLNGRGYPDGLQGDQIPVLVRIAAVADAFDAMTSTRAYRRALSTAEAIANLREEAKAGGLDHEIVEVLAEIVERDGTLWHSTADQAA